MSRILYTERKENWDKPAPGYDSRVFNLVEVEVRSWECRGLNSDVVVEERVMVDREIVIDQRKAYPKDRTDAEFIRLGIARFDELLAAHPTLAK